MIPISIDVPILLVGAPGTGKTASVLAAYDYVEVLLASTLVEEDISGLPYRKGEYDYRTIPAMFRRLQDAAAAGKTTCLFLDELDKARQSVADTLLTLIASRSMGSSRLPSTTAIVAAANPPELGGGDGISDAMISRFAVLAFVPDPDGWALWAQDRYCSPAARRIISAVRVGELPILDIAGDRLERRITSPRTLAYSLSIVERGGDHRLVQGLVTAGTASQILHLCQQAQNDVLDASYTLYRSSPKGKKIAPLRLP